MGKSIGTFLLTNPIGWIIDAAAAIALLAVLYKKFNISAEEANKNLKNAFDESKTFISSSLNLSLFEKVRYINLLTSGKLNSYLADIDRQAEAMFSRLVK